MSQMALSSLSLDPFASPKTSPSLSSLHSRGVPAPIPVLGPSEGSNTFQDDSHTLRTPVPIIPSSSFVGVPGALGGDIYGNSEVDVNAVKEHIESHSSQIKLDSPPRPLRARRPPPPPPVPTPSLAEKPFYYRTETVPCTREANATEISTILQAPSRLLGHKFTPSHGQEIWEAVEVSVGTTRTNGDDDSHRPAVPLRLQTPEAMEGKGRDDAKPHHWTKEPEKENDAFADSEEDDDAKPVPQLVGTGEVAVRFRGYEGTGDEHYMLVRDFVDMLKDRTVLIVEME